MLENVYGYSQPLAFELKLDFNDLKILSYVQAFIESGKMTTEKHQGKTYYWVLYSKMVEDVPLWYLTKRSLAERLKKLVNKGILEFYFKQKSGSYTFYRLTDFYYDKLVLPKQSEQYNYATEPESLLQSKLDNVCGSNCQPNVVETENKDNLLKDNLLKDNLLKDIKDTHPKKNDLDISTFVKDNISSTTLLNSVNEFIEHRNDMKKPMTYKAVELFVKKINGLKGMYSETEIIEIIDKSIINRWLDIYPPHESDRAKEQARLKEKEKVKTDYDWNEY